MGGQSLVARWNEALLESVRAGSAKPTATTYQLHLTSTAVYDAWAAYDDAQGCHFDMDRPPIEATEENKAEAISYAAYRMLSTFFPDRQARFDALMAELGYDPAVISTDPADPAGIGNLAAAAVFAARAEDGSNFAAGFTDSSGYAPRNAAGSAGPKAPGGREFDPNAWQPLRVPSGKLTNARGVAVYDDADPASFVDQIALTPHWGQVTPFSLAQGAQFRPPPPPRLGDLAPYTDALGRVMTGDRAWREQFGEVLEISGSLTTRQKVIAEFWADGPRTESPPGHWNQIAQDIALREGHGIDQDAQLFFAINAALFDAGIAVWDSKYAYDFVRPHSAIRHINFGSEVRAWAGPDLGVEMIPGEMWQPYQDVTFVTPPFPEYVSGHSAYSMAAARTIASFVGSDVYYDGVTLANYDLDAVPGRDLLGEYVTDRLSFETFPDQEPVVLRWGTLTEAAEEAGISRLYGGIHIQDANLRGQEIGRLVAGQVEARWQALFAPGATSSEGSDSGGTGALRAVGDALPALGASEAAMLSLLLLLPAVLWRRLRRK